MRIIVTGSRTWRDRYTIWDALNDELPSIMPVANGHGPDFIVMHGANPSGADRFAADWVEYICDYPGQIAQKPYPVTSEEWMRIGRGAGPLRNQRMIDDGADIVLAFVTRCVSPKCEGSKPHRSHGTADCIVRAHSAGIPVKEWVA